MKLLQQAEAIYRVNVNPMVQLNCASGTTMNLGRFVFPTTGFNSIRTLSTRLKYMRN